MIYQQMQITTIGSLVRTHGVKGAIVMRLLPGIHSTILDKMRWCFLLIRNKPVPFEIEDILASGGDEIVLQLNDVADKPIAEQLLNTDIAVELKKPLRKTKTEIRDSLIGYGIFSEGKIVGTIESIENTGKQLLFVIENEILIPAHEDLIESIDDKNHIIYMDLPEGLLK